MRRIAERFDLNTVVLGSIALLLGFVLAWQVLRPDLAKAQNQAQNQAQPGRYAMAVNITSVNANEHVYLLDTATGEIWRTSYLVTRPTPGNPTTEHKWVGWTKLPGKDVAAAEPEEGADLSAGTEGQPKSMRRGLSGTREGSAKP